MFFTPQVETLEARIAPARFDHGHRRPHEPPGQVKHLETVLHVAITAAPLAAPLVRDIGWFVQTVPDEFASAQYIAMIDKAFGRVEAVADIDAFMVDDIAEARVVFDARYIDGLLGTLATAEMPWEGDTQLFVTLDTAEYWHDLDGRRILQGPFRKDANRVLLHEIGHTLGLWHVATIASDPAIMQPLYSWNIWQLGPRDVAAITGLYGTAG